MSAAFAAGFGLHSIARAAGIAALVLAAGCGDDALGSGGGGEEGETDDAASSSSTGSVPPTPETTAQSTGGGGDAWCTRGTEDACYAGPPGRLPAPHPELLWSKSFGGQLAQVARAVATDTAGDVFVVGLFDGQLDLGGGALVSEGDNDVFVVKLDPSGRHLWSRRYGLSGPQHGYAVAVDADGNVIVVGGFRGTVDFGAGPVSAGSTSDAFVLKLDAWGNHVWSKHYGDLAGLQGAYAVGTDSANNVLVAGAFEGTMDLGSDELTSADDFDAFVVKLDSAGAYVWSKHFAGLGYQYVDALAFDAADNVVVAGESSASVDYGGGPLAAGSFLVKLDPAGNHAWSKSFDASMGSVAVDDSANVILAGYFSDSVDFGGGTLDSLGVDDAFVAKLDSSGNHVWSKAFGGPEDQHVFGVATDSAGNVALFGHFEGAVDFGGVPLMSADQKDLFLAKLDGEGTHLWSARFGGPSDQYAYSTCFDAAGHLVVTGSFDGTVDFGDGQLGTNDLDGYVAKFGP
ncbi:MAG: hypothetical protein HOV80_11965 [Polyangiaceae bacterium]|nr:hypothetical protein [Polyangiaceae bacterium]